MTTDPNDLIGEIHRARLVELDTKNGSVRTVTCYPF